MEGSFPSQNGQTLTLGTDYTYDAAKHLLTVPFSGATTLTVSDAYARFSPVDVWKTAYFGNLSDPAVSADEADPDTDGLTNLTEYATGLNPTTNSISTAPSHGKVLTENG